MNDCICCSILFTMLVYVILTLQKLIFSYVICKDSITYTECLDNLEEVEYLSNCSVDENEDLHQQIEPKIGMKFDRIEKLYKFLENMQRPLDFQLGKNPQRRM